MARPSRLPGTGRAWWFIVIVVVVLASAGSGVAKLNGLSDSWAFIVAVVVVAVPLIGLRALGELDRRRSRQLQIEGATAGATAGRSTPRDTSLARLGVHPAVRTDVDYVPRDCESEVVRAITIDRRVLIVGPAMAGKSRLAVSAARTAVGDYCLYTPRNAEALNGLLTANADFDNAVVWLDDLENFVSTNLAAELTTLRDRHPSAVVIATMRTSQLQLLQTDNQVKPVGADVPAWFGEAIRVGHAWSPAELERLSTTRVGPQIANQAATYGLGCYLGGAPLVEQRVLNGPTENPVGHAVVQAVVDWRRAGLDQPVTSALLATVVPAYVTLKHLPTLNEQLKDGINWATRRLNQTVALVQEEQGGYHPLDLVVDRLSSTPIPAIMWQACLAVATPDESERLGYIAYVHDERDTAEQAWVSAATRIESTLAMFAVGVLRLEQNPPDLVGARRWWEQAAAAGDSAAAFNLGQSFYRADPPDLVSARRWWEQAAAAGHSAAAFNLGQSFYRADPPDLVGAHRWWEQAAAAGHTAAANNLGVLLSEANPPDLVRARRWWEQAAAVGHTDAAFSLGQSFDRADPPDLVSARRWWEQAAAAGHTDAAFSLGLSFYRADPPDLVGARRWWEQAATAGHTDAAFYFGALLTRLDPPDLVGARRWWEQAAAAGDTDAMFNLGLSFDQADPPDRMGARRWWKQAAGAGHREATQRLRELEEGSP